jgi:hypothetical protein
VRVKPGTAPRQRGSRTLADDDQSKMMRGIWLELHAMSIVRDPSEAALLRRRCGDSHRPHDLRLLNFWKTTTCFPPLFSSLVVRSVRMPSLHACVQEWS